MEDEKIKTTDMTRKIRDKFARRLAGKTHSERMAFYRQQAIKMDKMIPTLLNQLGLDSGSYSKDFSTWPGNKDMDTIVTNIREKQVPYKKAK